MGISLCCRVLVPPNTELRLLCGHTPTGGLHVIHNNIEAACDSDSLVLSSSLRGMPLVGTFQRGPLHSSRDWPPPCIDREHAAAENAACALQSADAEPMPAGVLPQNAGEGAAATQADSR